MGEGETTGHYPILVYGADVKDAKVRVFTRAHTVFEMDLGTVELTPGAVRSVRLDGRVEDNLLWAESFDLCVWGGDVVGNRNGLAPVSEATSLETVSGYDYARTVVAPSFPGSAYIQPAYSEETAVAQNHSMTDSYIISRGFDDYSLVLSHDHTCNRMTTGKGDISTMTFDSLATFNLKTAHNVAIPGTRITTFKEALELCKDRIVINVDQGFQYYDMVVALTDSLDMTDQILIKGKKAREVVAREMEGSRMMYMPIIDIQKAKGKDLFAQYEDWYAQKDNRPGRGTFREYLQTGHLRHRG